MSNFIEQGVCLYTVVVPAEANKECKFAAQELAYVIGKASKAPLSVVTETDELPEKCLHIGDTAVALAAGVKPSLEEVGADGYVIKKRGDTVFISSFGKEGVIYGVYEFLQKVVGSEYFGYLAWEIPQVENATLLEEDILRKPAFEKRARSFQWGVYDTQTERRFGYNEANAMPWVEFEHSFFRLIPKEKYYKDHPEYYSSQSSQLCLTNEGLLAEMKKVVISRLTPAQFERGDVLAFSIGHEDNNTFCECPRCKKAAKKYGKSGVTIRFINEIADTINAFVDKNYPGKTVKTVFFGYGPTIDAPVKWSADGTCIPIDDTVVAHRNVAVMLAPLGSNWAYSLLDKEHNGRTRASLIGWKAIHTELFIWTYDGVFHDIPLPMDNWEYLKESYQIFKDCNAVYNFDEWSGRGHQFEMMRHYVRGHLMWSLDYEVDDLIRRFMKGYYKEAADKVYEYYRFFRANTKEQEKRFEKLKKPFAMRSFTRTQPYWISEEFWTKAFLKQSLEMLEAAKSGLKNDGVTSVANRVELEMLSLACLYLQLYVHELSKTEAEKYFNLVQRVMEINQLVRGCGEGGVHNLFYKRLTEWRAIVNAKEI